LAYMRYLLTVFWLAGCVSGQTGSPDCVPQEACVCDPLYGAGTPLRVRVERRQDLRLEAVVEAIVPSTFGTNGVAVGDRVGGTVDVAQPCNPQAPLVAAEGDELLVLFTPGQNDGGTLLEGQYAWAIPWAEPLSFGADHDLPRAELSVLSDPSRCLERFPADPGPPCHDTQTVTCATAPSPAPADRDGLWCFGLGVVAARVWRRRPKRPAT
jgi:hypothetical protein